MFIDTRNFSEQWWGNGEPISITAFKREKNTKVGKITNIHFRNLTCHSSNGIVIAAESVGNVDNIVFDQCQFDIATKSKWQPEGIDYRPNSKTYYKNEGTPVAIQIQNVKSITFQHSMFHVNKHTKNVIDNSATYLK